VPDDDVEARVTSLEQKVARLREQIALTSSDAAAARADAAAARVLAAGADRDISEVRTELRAHTQALNALREIQVEQGQEMRESFASQERRIGELEREMQGGFATMATGMAQITTLLTEIRGLEGDG
jgi:predicted  nucleic acid-binding Zn-ribbon protein